MNDRLGPLRPQPDNQSQLGSLIVSCIGEMVEMANKQDLIVKEAAGKRVGIETIVEEIQLVFHALGREYFGGNRVGMLRNEHQLAEIADIAPAHARLLVDQCWPMLNRLLLTLLVHDSILPKPTIQRMLTWTGRVNGNPAASWRYADDRVLTPLLQTVLIPGVAEILIDGVAWQCFDHGGMWHRRIARRVGRTAQRRLVTPEGAAQALFEETRSFTAVLENSPLKSCRALARDVPITADVWGIGPPDPATGQPTGERCAPGDLPDLLVKATEFDLPTLMASMVAREGKDVGSFDVGDVFVDNGLIKLKGQTLRDGILAMRSPFNEIFEDILLHDEHERAARSGVPKGVRYVNSRGNIVIGGIPHCMLVRMTMSGEPSLFVHNVFPTERSKSMLVSAAEALVGLQCDPSTASCLRRSFVEMGAPFSVLGPSNGARFGMFGLGCAFNMLLIAVVRRQEMEHLARFQA